MNIPSARRYNENDDPGKYDFSVKYVQSQSYSGITMKRLARQLHKHFESEDGIIAGVKLRDTVKKDHWFNINMNDLKRLSESIDRCLEANPDGGNHMPYEREESAVENACEPSDDASSNPPEDGGEATGCTVEDAGETVFEGQEDDGPHTEFRFCCYAMMDAMLGGSGIMISLDSGELQIGERNLMYCPFCGQSIITHTPPAKVE